MRGTCTAAIPISPSSSSSHLPSFIASLITVRRFHSSTTTTVRSGDLGLHCHYQKNATKYWDNFYKRHKNKVGCGAGNTIFPLLTAYPNLYVHACDFSPHAIRLVKLHEDFREDRVNAFVSNVIDDDLSEKIIPSSVDVVTLIFMLSAVSPKKMHLILQNVKKVLKPNGYVLLRDYAIGDFAQVKLQDRNQMIGDNFYVRGDGTCSFYFSEDFLSTLFTKAGFNTIDITIYCKQIENRSRNITMDRRWIRAIFSNLDCDVPHTALNS